jgi:hypothetical protein
MAQKIRLLCLFLAVFVRVRVRDALSLGLSFFFLFLPLHHMHTASVTWNCSCIASDIGRASRISKKRRTHCRRHPYQSAIHPYRRVSRSIRRCHHLLLFRILRTTRLADVLANVLLRCGELAFVMQHRDPCAHDASPGADFSACKACEWVKQSQQSFANDKMGKCVVLTKTWGSHMVIKILQCHLAIVFVSKVSCTTQSAAYELMMSAVEVLYYRN